MEPEATSRQKTEIRNKSTERRKRGLRFPGDSFGWKSPQRRNDMNGLSLLYRQTAFPAQRAGVRESALGADSVRHDGPRWRARHRWRPAAPGGELRKTPQAARTCDHGLGTLAVVEDQRRSVVFRLRRQNLGSTVPRAPADIQQSNCSSSSSGARQCATSSRNALLDKKRGNAEGSKFGKGQFWSPPITQ